MTERVDMPEVAVWYYQHGWVYVTVGRADWEIAGMVSMSDAGDCAPAGVQYPDGTYNEWRADPLVKAEEDRRTAEWRRELEESKGRPAPSTRKIAAPFVNRDGERPTTTVLADTPRWVGAAP